MTDAPDRRARARLGLSGVRRAQGDSAAALELLEAVPAAARARLDVRRERCRDLRALDRPREAFGEYEHPLAALKTERPPPAWWEVAEAMARTYVEAGEVPKARKLLEGLRRRDRTFGGDPERRERILWLMSELDRT